MKNRILTLEGFQPSLGQPVNTKETAEKTRMPRNTAE
jgi:hypothetical protein